MHPSYESETRKWLQAIPEKGAGIFFDVGAHCGIYSILYAKEFKHVYAFEPQPDSFRALLENVSLNDLAASITCLSQAVSNYSGTGNLLLAQSEDNCALIAGEAANSVQVPVTTIDDFLAENLAASEVIRLIKLDIEGKEIDALEGAARVIEADNPIMIVEVLNEAAHRTIETYLTSLGYRSPVLLDQRNLCFTQRS
jgi:FkbM family methyltransferase